MTLMNISNIRVLKDNYIQRVLRNKNKLCMTLMNILNIRLLKDKYIQRVLQNKNKLCMTVLMNISDKFSSQGKLYPLNRKKMYD